MVQEYCFLCSLTPDLTIQLPGGPPMQRALAGLTRDGVEVEVTVRRHTKRRTAAQNRYIHGVIVPVVQHWLRESQGENVNHDNCYYMLRQIVGDSLQIKLVGGIQVISLTGKRFSEMNTQEFGEAVEKIKVYFSPKGCAIPDPTQHNFINDFL